MGVRIGIGVKLFASVLLASVTMAVAVGIASRVSFQRSFLSYLNELDSKRMEALTAILAQQWREEGLQHGWEMLRGREELWRRIVRHAGYRVYGDGLSLLDLPPLSFPHDRDHGSILGHRPLVPGEASVKMCGDGNPQRRRAHTIWREASAQLQSGWHPPPPPLPPGHLRVPRHPPLDEGPLIGRGEPPPPPLHEGFVPSHDIAPVAGPEGGGDAATRMTLQDAQGKYVVGNPSPGPDAQYEPILVDGTVAGWVVSMPFDEVTDSADLAFKERQERVAWYVALLAVLMAGLIAWLLGRGTLVPARRLALAAHELAHGNYGIRVQPEAQDELGELSRVFNRLANTLQQNENMRRAFMADVSHELRTPLSIMRGELEAVEDGLQPLDERLLQSLQAEVYSLAKLVDDIHVLSMAEVAALSYQWQPVDVVDLVDTDLPGWQERLAGKGLGLKRIGLVDRITVSGDPDRLRQVFNNLMENTVRYVDAGGAVEVGIQTEAGHVSVTVDDSGPGMPPEEHARLFDRFYRREASRNRATGGSGLGLAICRGIVEAHGGSIAAMSSPLGGLRIRITLPMTGSSGGSV